MQKRNSKQLKKLVRRATPKGSVIAVGPNAKRCLYVARAAVRSADGLRLWLTDKPKKEAMTCVNNSVALKTAKLLGLGDVTFAVSI